MAKKTQYTQPESRELSIADLRKAITNIGRRIDDLRQFDVNTVTERFDAKTQALKDKANSTLADIFGHGTVEYRKYDIPKLEDLPMIISRKYHLQEVIRATKKGINNAVIKLKSLKETLQEKLEDEHEDESSSQTVSTATPDYSDSKEVFIVHGQDNEAKLAVDSFIKKLDLKPVILHEKPNEGRTIIEKFEKHSKVGFAVVLMTPDDVGALAKDKDKLNPRARQNVILELGFFLGKLGRKHVCALYKEGVEMPSDYDGVLFIPMDKNDGWKLSLAREIQAAGIDIDMNKAL